MTYNSFPLPSYSNFVSISFILFIFFEFSIFFLLFFSSNFSFFLSLFFSFCFNNSVNEFLLLLISSPLVFSLDSSSLDFDSETEEKDSSFLLFLFFIFLIFLFCIFFYFCFFDSFVMVFCSSATDFTPI